MKEKNKIIRNSEKIEIDYAGSCSDRIGFYFYLDDDTIGGVEGIETDSGCLIKFCHVDENEVDENEVDENEVDENEPEDIKSAFDKKYWIKLLFLAMGMAMVGMHLLYLASVTGNFFGVLLLFIISFFIMNVIMIVINEEESMDYSNKSKHAVEHKVCNFIEHNQRLPRNMEEIKRASRFCSDCNSQESFYEIVDNFIKDILVVIITMAINNFVPIVYSTIICFVLFFERRVIIDKILEENEVMENIVENISILLGYILQCVNTTSKVEDKDIFLAYSVAKIWMQIVYPEYYNPNDEFPIPDNFKVNSN